MGAAPGRRPALSALPLRALGSAATRESARLRRARLMADQLRWWKLWTAALTDPDLEGLSLEDWARWARLGAFTTLHGDHGVCHATYPATALVESLRIGGRGGVSRHGQTWCWNALIKSLLQLPGIGVAVQGDGAQRSATITWKNWRKYQEDSSAERTRRWREDKRLRDGQSASRCDDPETVTGRDGRDGQPASHVTVQPGSPRPGNPIVPLASPSQPRPNGRPERPPDRPESYRHDCPNRGWRGQCVDRRYLAAHPDFTTWSSMPDPDRPDADPMLPSSYVPKSCPAHR